MPRVKVGAFNMNYEQQGAGDALILIPYLAADNACYAFQVGEYAKQFTCISVDLRGTGASDDPPGEYSTETLADDVAAFMQTIGVQSAHVAGLSLGAAVGIWIAAKYPDKVKSLSLHSSWAKTDAYSKAVVESWRLAAKAWDSVPEMIIRCIFPWCFTPELYESRPDYIQSLTDFVRSRPPQSVPAFLRQSNAVLGHDASAQVAKIAAPTLLTYGAKDQLTSTRFAEPLKAAIRNSELMVFDGCSHAPIYENVEEFNQKTLEFLLRHGSAGQGRSA
jgi:pimeloyl-ACP methyl ester carboxylesterase